MKISVFLVHREPLAIKQGSNKLSIMFKPTMAGTF